MKKLNLIFSLALFLFLLAAPLAVAQMGRMQMKGPGMSCAMMEKAEELGLTAEQQAKIKTIHLEAKKEEIKLKADIELAQLDLKQLMTADTPKESEILKAVDNVGLLKTKLRKAEIRKKLATHQVLTKEQLAKWREMKKEGCGMECKHKMMMKGEMMEEMGPGMMRGNPKIEVEKKIICPKTGQ